MKQIVRKIFSRATFTGVFILLQFLVLYLVIVRLNERFVNLYFVANVLSALVAIYIVGRDTNSAYKIAWLLPILGVPVFGLLLYAVFGRNRLSRRKRKQMYDSYARYREAMSHASQQPAKDLETLNPAAARQSRYLAGTAHAPLFQHTQTTYLPVGEAMFAALMQQLKKAERFIFLEYYILEPGRMWDDVLAVLREKRSRGVDVRIIYDDFGCMFRLPDGYETTLERAGLQCKVFNPFRAHLSPQFNNRDHRKICVIDGNVGFTGGINIADRYINEGTGYDGHWLDTAVMLQGEAVWSLAMMFLTMWDFVCDSRTAFDAYRPDPAYCATVADDGFVQPFTDTPIDDESTGSTVYRNMIGCAQRYVYINTPYLIIDNEMLTALAIAAKSGVDVRLTLPKKCDGRIVQEMTRSYYEPLAQAGVKIYEYQPGMVHAKTFVSDDTVGVVGTINLDYRSLYLHFECAVWMCNASAVTDMRDAYLAALSRCRQITMEELTKVSLPRRLLRRLLRVLAPLF